MIRTARLLSNPLLIAALAGGMMVLVFPRGFEGMGLAAGVAGAILLTAAVRRRRRPNPAGSQMDVLRGTLGLKKVAETDGVQWALRVLPDRLTVPGYAVMAVLVQNACDRPRIVQVHLRHCPVPRDGSAIIRVALKAGEVGLLRIPVFLPRELRPGSYLFSVDLTASMPEGPGIYLLPRARSGGKAARSATLLVLGSHGGQPLNLWAYEWDGFQPLYAMRQTAPDLDPLRILEELQAAPPA